MTTLKDRLQTALDAKEGASKAGLAKACHISKASVTNWFNGRTASLDGNNQPGQSGLFLVRNSCVIAVRRLACANAWICLR